MAVEGSGTLTLAESTRLEQLEAKIHGGIQTFVEVGLALTEIRNSRLYRRSHSTFADYCRERWQFTRQRAHQLIAGAAVARDVSTRVDVSEKTLRPLAKLPPAERKPAFEKAKALAGDKPVTTKHVETAIGRTIPVLGPPADGMQFARMALMDLEQIRDDDVERDAAFGSVQRWLAGRGEAPAKRQIEDAERRHEWENGVVVGAKAALSALREHPEYEALSIKIITHVVAELFESRRKVEIEVALYGYLALGANVSPTDTSPAPPVDPGAALADEREARATAGAA